jgi:hypothetical protein
VLLLHKPTGTATLRFQVLHLYDTARSWRKCWLSPHWPCLHCRNLKILQHSSCTSSVTYKIDSQWFGSYSSQCLIDVLWHKLPVPKGSIWIQSSPDAGINPTLYTENTMSLR